MLLLAGSTAEAARPEEPIEEIIVYADDFARWDHTRWLLQSEMVLPLGTLFSSDTNKAFNSYAFQVRAVVACEKDLRLGKHRWEVSCAIEDLGLLATSENRWRREQDRALVEEVLTEVDRRMTGARVQMQVDDGGGITNFDIEGIDSDNLRERQIQETTRQLMSRVMAGFHLRIPDHGQRAGTWVEYHSELMDLPSLTASRGTSTLIHGVSPYGEGLQIVQTRGEGTAIVNLPNTPIGPWPPEGPELSGDSGGGSEGGVGAAVTMVEPLTLSGGGPPLPKQGESGLEASFRLTVEGVAVFRKDSGIMSERVWTCVGMPTAGSARNVGPYRNLGRITLLGEDEHPDVGPTMQVAWPTRTMEGLAPWVSIETLPSSDPG